MVAITLEGSRNYQIVRGLGRKKHQIEAEKVLVNISTYKHTLEDGEELIFNIRPIKATEKATIERHSEGFKGFGWIMDNLIEEILADTIKEYPGTTSLY